MVPIFTKGEKVRIPAGEPVLSNRVCKEKK
ncbi:hypothetical protein SAN_1004, partial [Streptococcus agalactiae COH1]